MALAASAGSGLTSLPASEDRLVARLQSVEQSFRGEAPQADADYLFVLEDEKGRLVGTSGMLGAAGMREPWYSYRMGLTVAASRGLDIYRQQPTLFLVNDLTGATALCSYFLDASARQGDNARLLSKARFMFMADCPQDFSSRVIVEMRGLSDSAGRSPFWDSLGQHFFRMDFARADYLTGIGNKAFIAEMMPKFPLYACFLSDAAREAIGQPGGRCLRRRGCATRDISISLMVVPRLRRSAARCGLFETVVTCCYRLARPAMMLRPTLSTTVHVKAVG